MKVMMKSGILLALLISLWGCGQVPVTTIKPKAAPIAKAEPRAEKTKLPTSPPMDKVVLKKQRRVPETDPQLAILARQKIKRAQKLYTSGEYDRAEALLKQSITTFPFLAQAQLTLGKIFLIKGSASRDMALLNSARLMFEMAAAIDPGLAEVQTLLELFTVSYPE